MSEPRIASINIVHALVDDLAGRVGRTAIDKRPVPGHPEATPTQALLTLTTCNPRWNSSHRMIVFGHLVSTRAK